MRPGSPHSSISAEDRTTLASICLAKALVDSLPNPYDKEALRFKVRILLLIFFCTYVIFMLKQILILLINHNRKAISSK